MIKFRLGGGPEYIRLEVSSGRETYMITVDPERATLARIGSGVTERELGPGETVMAFLLGLGVIVKALEKGAEITINDRGIASALARELEGILDEANNNV